MNYKEVVFTLTPHTQVNEDILIALLCEHNFDSFWQNDEQLKAYIPSSLYLKDTIQNICKTVENTIKIEWEVKEYQEKNWNEIWESNFPFILIGDNCIVKAPFHTDAPKLEYEIIIEPKMSFGTGHHATTSLMCELILGLDITDKIILDMGCGTGILAILASLKKASKITAIDFDEWAYNNTLENIKKNNCNNIQAIKGDASNIPDIKYDVIFANINRNVLLEDLQTYVSRLTENGILLISGIMMSDKEVIWQKTKELQLQSSQIIEKSEWIAAIFSKSIKI